MAHTWRKEETGQWEPRPIDESLAIEITSVAGRWVAWVEDGQRVRVNGVPADLGLRVLEDRDEIRAGGETFYFSTEERAEVTRYPGDERAIYCPRCKQEIPAGAEAVRCPNPKCGCWHHQSEGLPCWSYSKSCALCPQPTALDGEFVWRPEEV